MLAIDLGIAKTHKYASRDSGDSVEVVERPGGGISLVMIDGQGSGAAAKSLSMQLTSRAVAMLKDGVRDGAVARAVHDSLFAFRHGKVQATLDIVSVDLKSRTLVVTRNADTPLVVAENGSLRAVESSTGPIGLYHFTRPAVSQYPIEAGISAITFTDGVAASGRRTGLGAFDVASLAGGVVAGPPTAQELADLILEEALQRDSGRPGDDMSVAVIKIVADDGHPPIRRLMARIPI